MWVRTTAISCALRRTLYTAVLAASALGASATVSSAAPYVLQTVDAAGAVGKYTSIAVDAQGNPHISYYDNTFNWPKYAVKMNGSWTTDAIPAKYEGDYTSIALDGQGNPHITYSGASGVRYAVKTETSWNIETVDSGTSQYTSLALDAQGNPHVIYVRLTFDDLKYAVKTGGSWTIEVVDAGDVGQEASLALDSGGNPHVSYHNFGNGDLEYAVKTGGSWTTETVESGSAGFYSSLALDSEDNPHIAYLVSGAGGGIRYAVKTGGSWTIETLDAGSFAGSYPEIALDAQDTPHVSYHDVSSSGLGYAVRSGGSWTIETVDAAGFTGLHTSISVDAEGTPHMSYYDDTNDDLRYARGTTATAVAGGPSVTAFRIRSFWPNPASSAQSQVTMAFDLPAPATVTARLYDTAGRLVQTEASRAFVRSGTQRLPFDVGRLASGVYFLRLTTATGETAYARLSVIR